MSKIYSSDCVSCGLPCWGRTCPHYQRVDYYCDYCEDYAEYEIDGEHYCKECAEKFFHEIFDDLSLNEKGELLKVNIRDL